MTRGSLYPSYVDFDPFIDLARLRALDDYVRDRLQRRIAAARDLAFYTGPFTLQSGAETLPGSLMVRLSRSEREEAYYDLDRTGLWRPAPEAEEFAELMDFLATLPFESTGRMLIFYDEAGRPVTAHRDHDRQDISHEFVWLRTNLDKPFYLLDPRSGEKIYIAGHSAWFDTVNQYHGADDSAGLTWSIRVDGRFSAPFRSRIPDVPANPASRPSVWAFQSSAAGQA